jgi:hypothetical protein
MMMILRELGYSIAGRQYVGTERASNPDGVWEIPRIARNGLSMDMYCGKTNLCDNLTQYDVIKLVSYALTSSAPKIFSEVIVCTRNPLEVAQSQERAGYKGDLLFDIASNHVSLMKWLGQWMIPFTVVDYNSMIVNPKWEISGICGFLTAKRNDRFTSEDMIRATKVVNPKYYRNRL